VQGTPADDIGDADIRRSLVTHLISAAAVSGTVRTPTGGALTPIESVHASAGAERRHEQINGDPNGRTVMPCRRTIWRKALHVVAGTCAALPLSAGAQGAGASGAPSPPTCRRPGVVGFNWGQSMIPGRREPVTPCHNSLAERRFVMFAFRTVAAAVVLTTVGISAVAQTPSADERAIRDLIARYDRGESVARTADDILWTADFARPVIGRQRGGFLFYVEPFTPDLVAAARAAAAASPRVPGSRRRVTTPVRIEIAQSGDLAYEFSNSDLSFDLKSGGRDVTTSSVLRVWKKEEGQWKIAALFARPHDVEATAR
jgi:hypothetical protein